MENMEQRSGDERRESSVDVGMTETRGDERREAMLDLENTTFKVGRDTSFQVKGVDTNEDGSVDIALDMDDATKEKLCTTFGWDKVTEDRLQTLVINALDWYTTDGLVTKMDGGDVASTVHEKQKSAAE